jgi:nucleoside-diphosphate-sugar epimerase
MRVNQPIAVPLMRTGLALSRRAAVTVGNRIDQSRRSRCAPIRKLADKVLLMTGSQSEVTFGWLPTDDLEPRQSDINGPKGRLGWEPIIPLETALKQTINDFRIFLKHRQV